MVFLPEFLSNFGLLGSYVIDVVAMIICLVLITERSALKGVQKGSRKVYETAKESNERHRELAEQRREERELRRMDRKVEGVAVDTRVLPDRKAEPMGSDEVSEINIDKLLEQSNTNLPEIKEEKHVTLQPEAQNIKNFLLWNRRRNRMLLRPHFLRKRLRQKSWKRMHQSFTQSRHIRRVSIQSRLMKNIIQ